MLGLRQNWPAHFGVEVDGREVLVEVRKNQRAKHYRLSLKRGGGAIVTVPPRGKIKEVQDFLDKQRHWLAARLKRMPPAIRFEDGAIFPLRGEETLIKSSDKLRGRVEHFAGGHAQNEIAGLVVPGGHEHLARRLTDWLKKQALADLKERTAFHAKRLQVQPQSIALKSQSTRWGSCSSAGRLNYNWRLVLAPPFVLDYVAAHEVAHLVEMNHSDAFWRVVEETLPDMERGRSWLKSNGGQLMAIGV